MDYVIGDVQGCYIELMRLLDKIQFDESSDCLWFVGDLVNRGPDSLAVLQFLSSLGKKPIVTLGNHDLHYLAVYYGVMPYNSNKDSFEKLLRADDVDYLSDWLRHQSIAHFDSQLNIFMAHAGLYPAWSISETLLYAKELENVLTSGSPSSFLGQMYGNNPSKWKPSLTGIERLRFIVNAFTRMRLLAKDSVLELKTKDKREVVGLTRWFDMPRKDNNKVNIVFGHWAALEGETNRKDIWAVDTGCVYGGRLTALCLQTMERISVPGSKS